MQPAEQYNAIFSKQKCNPDHQNAGQKEKGPNPGPNGQNKSAKNGKPR